MFNSDFLESCSQLDKYHLQQKEWKYKVECKVNSQEPIQYLAYWNNNYLIFLIMLRLLASWTYELDTTTSTKTKGPPPKKRASMWISWTRIFGYS